MDIYNLMKKQMVFIDLDVSNKEECIKKMINGMQNAGHIANKDIYFEAVLEREKKGTTGVGFGIAIPHGKSDGVLLPSLAFAKLSKPIDWNAMDGKPVQIVFLIGVPEKSAGNEHLQILITISKKLIYEDFRKQLFEAKSYEQVTEVLKAI